MRKNLTQVSTFFSFEYQTDSSVKERKASRPLSRSAGSLESSEGSEKRILVYVLGSLKAPCKTGVPMGPSGLMESA